LIDRAGVRAGLVFLNDAVPAQRRDLLVASAQ
jgi:hypothetical protein